MPQPTEKDFCRALVPKIALCDLRRHESKTTPESLANHGNKFHPLSIINLFAANCRYQISDTANLRHAAAREHAPAHVHLIVNMISISAGLWHFQRNIEMNMSNLDPQKPEGAGMALRHPSI